MGKITDVKILKVEEFNKLNLISSNIQNNDNTLIPIYWKYVYKELLNVVEAKLLSKDAQRCLITPSIVSDEYAAAHPDNNLYATLECYLVYISYDGSKPDWIEETSPEIPSENAIYISKEDLNNAFNDDSIIGKSIEAKYSKNVKKLDLQINIKKEYARKSILSCIYIPVLENIDTIAYSLIPEIYEKDIENNNYKKFIRNKVYNYAYPSFLIKNGNYTIQDVLDSYCEKHDENNSYTTFTLLTSCCKLLYKIWTTPTSYIIKVKSTEIPDNSVPCYLIWPNMVLIDIPSIFSKYHIGVMDNSEYYEKM